MSRRMSRKLVFTPISAKQGADGHPNEQQQPLKHSGSTTNNTLRVCKSSQFLDQDARERQVPVSNAHLVRQSSLTGLDTNRIPQTQIDTSKTMDVHKALSVVPYCGVCKKYLQEFLEVDNFTYFGAIEKKKRAFTSWKKRFGVLCNEHFAYYEDSSDVGKSLPKGILHLEKCDIRVGDGETDFYLSVDKTRYHLKTSSSADRAKWMQCLKYSDDNNELSLEKIPKHSSFCHTCNKHFDLDNFTLCDADGKFVVDGVHMWCVLSEKHIATFAKREDVKSYNPVRVFHILAPADAYVMDSTGGVSIPCTAEHGEHVTLTLKTDTAEQREEWIEVLKSL